MNHLSSLVQITPQNIDSEHICCALGNTPDAIQCTCAKKNWMLQSFAAGYHFCKLNERGKAFIEYIPAHFAWAPIVADGWLFIDCLWVSGRFKGQGYGSLLLQQAILHAQQAGYVGLVAITSDKKRPFLSDPLFYQKSILCQLILHLLIIS